ncbi:PKD domain-containing protein [Methanosarcina sp.]|uniref:PKD domain-containing protein n=1 Tax=Methanosarcina sp. TaxID=2213 RepID=UPI002989696D|nr:PKD domain-containing protein [Methanosarcina sp.]MDW5549603.1 PKD domain-containing protein [Methanosarcina sp.]MDW5553635.1 PKD domain-containing protein [Methanosarcina sp.]MDW5558559.1 PKD domain-containing protein [Methanosarcina sp.]
MKINTKSYSVALASAVLILFLILVSSTASAVTEQTASLTINKTQITTSGSAACPSIYGDRIVWQDWRNGNKNDGPFNIYMYNISTHKETQITTSGSAACPSIYGDRIVWKEWRNGNQNDTEEEYDVYMYDLSTHKETQINNRPIPYDYLGYSFGPHISGNTIMWGGPHGYYIYDISTQETHIDNMSAPSPVFFDNIVVWVPDIDGRPSNLIMYDLSTHKKTQITNSDSAFNPDIYGDIIVWADWRQRDDGYQYSEIYMYDLSTKKETQITNSGSAFYYSPRISEDRIVWLDNQDSGSIYMYNISTQEEAHTNNTSIRQGFTFYGDKIVWSDWDNEKTNVYMGTLTSSNLPTAAFSASPTSGKAPMKVQFTDKSTGTPKKWKWDFGDGTTSTKQNPTHKYSKAGVYTVKLTVTNAAGSNTVTKSNYITVAAKPVAAFSVSPTSGKAPLNVKFTDASTGTPKKWKWDFGDGTKSFLQNPTHKYSKAGKYTITLTVTNAAGINTVTKSNYITVTAKPAAVFSASPTSGKSPLDVKFTDKSTGSPKKWKWDFGDGTISTKQNPTHKYSKAGKYTVTLKVTNAVGINTATKSNYITVTGTSQAPTADFWGWPLSGKAPLKVKFTETSKGSPTSWKWDFGDGKSSTEKSPTHTYSAAGTYTVKLTATNAAGSSTKTKWNYIKVAK